MSVRSNPKSLRVPNISSPGPKLQIPRSGFCIPLYFTKETLRSVTGTVGQAEARFWGFGDTFSSCRLRFLHNRLKYKGTMSCTQRLSGARHV